jgi:type IV pilus assembly protein PilX
MEPIMYRRTTSPPLLQRGMALVAAMLLLLVLVILGAALLRSSGIEEKTAGNTREKQRALHAAASAQTYAEWWLTAGAGVNATSGSGCDTTSPTPRVCSNLMQNAATLPWTAGVSYTPPMLTVANAGVSNAYYAAPNFYISYLSGSYNTPTGTQTNLYQVDAQGYAGTQNAAAVVESTYSVSVTYTTHTDDTKFVSLAGP